MWTEFFTNGKTHLYACGQGHEAGVRTKMTVAVFCFSIKSVLFSVIMINKVTFDLDSHRDVCPEPTL